MAPDSANSPWWINFIKQVGVPAAAMLFLLWFVIFQQSSQMNNLAAQMAEAQRNMGIFAVEQRGQDGRVADLLRTLIDLQRAQINLARQACLSDAKTVSDRKECLK